MIEAVFIDFYGTVVHMGDSLSSDIKGATSVGINAVWINRRLRQGPEGVASIGNLLELFDTEYFNKDKK